MPAKDARNSARWDFFVAHAGSDREAAESLYSHLHGRARVFLDSRCLKPGDDWSAELPRAQETARVTVVLVSRHTERAYYQREEIAAAIDAARRRPGEHRVVPVYLDVNCAERPDVPYGLRIRHGIVGESAGGMASVAGQLLDLLEAPSEAGEFAAPPFDLLHAGVTGFVGRAERGPVGRPVRVTSYAGFVADFGPPVDPSVSYLGYAVRGFFENGGREAEIVRVVPGDAAAAAAAVPADDGEACLIVRALNPGAWGNRLSVEIGEGARIGIRLVVALADPGSNIPTPAEDYDNLSVDPSGPNFLLRELEAGSALVRLGWLGSLGRCPQSGTWVLSGGADGGLPTWEDYAGSEDPTAPRRGLAAVDADSGVALLCVPDCCQPSWPPQERERLAAAVIAHCERRGEMFAILAADAGVKDPRAPFDTGSAALYAPWIRVASAGNGTSLLVPPVGHVAGAYVARDVERGLSAPLTQLSVTGLSASGAGHSALDAGFDAVQADRLRRRGVNALRAAGVPGTAVAATAVTMALDAGRQPVHLQRQLCFLRRTLTLGTQWMIFEPSTADAHQRLVEQIEEFLETLRRQGMLAGASAAEAFTVRCDGTTMTQDDRENGRTIAHVSLQLADPRIGVAFVLVFAGFNAESRLQL